MDRIDSLVHTNWDSSKPVELFNDGQHAVYWVGAEEKTPFRCNAYLIVDGSVRVLFDPGSTMHHFPQVKARVAAVCPIDKITHIVLHHQDPDLCDSLPAWIALNPDVTLVCTPRCRVLLPYYGFSHDVAWHDISPMDNTVLELPSGNVLGFITSPFLHFPEACVTFDERSGFLLSSDIGAAIESDWHLVVDEWDKHWKSMVPFHVFYMASNRAMRGFIDKIEPFPITAILPQHGSIIPKQFVKRALHSLRELPCGLDLLYPASNLESALNDMVR